MVSLHGLPPTALVPLVLPVLPRQVQGRCAVCPHRQRHTMWRPARTILSRLSLHLNLLRHNSPRLLFTSRSHLSSRSQPGFLTLTTVQELPLLVSRRLLHHPLLDWLDLLVRRLQGLSPLTDVLTAHRQKYAPSSRTVLALLVTATRDRTRLSITLILLQAVVSPAAHPHLRLLLLLPKLLLETARIVHRLLRQSGTESGKSLRSCRATTRNVKSLRSLTAVARLLPTMPRPHRFLVRALRSILTLDALTMATTLQRLLIILHRWHPLTLLKRPLRRPCLGCQRPLRQPRRRLVPNIMSQPLAT